MNPLSVIFTALALFAACALLVSLRRAALIVAYPLCLLAALLAAGTDLFALFSAEPFTARVALGLPTIGLRFRLDALSAFFGVVINVGIFAACLYGLGFNAGKELTRRVEPFFALFALAMNLVLLADDAFSFLFAWELMSVTSWALVIANHRQAESRRAAHLYLVMASIGTMALLFAFGAMAGPAGGHAFETIRSTSLEPLLAGLILAGVIIGTGSKAGIMPLHAWLPLAHRAAPSHVSALVSGVMTKVAIYGLLRIVALAIFALPPLNGFVSEWLLFQAVLAGPEFDEPVLRFLSPVVGGLLALAAGLAAACFVRVFGIVFLGRARSDAAANAPRGKPTATHRDGLFERPVHIWRAVRHHAGARYRAGAATSCRHANAGGRDRRDTFFTGRIQPRAQHL